MFTAPQVFTLLLIATLGHLMAVFWYLADKYRWKICERTIYDLPIGAQQIKREVKNSLHTPMHAVILAVFLYLGFSEIRAGTRSSIRGLQPRSGRRFGTTRRIGPSICARCTGSWSTTRAA